MIYISENKMKEIGINWEEIIDVIGDSVECIKKEKFSQPIKPYLRYGDLKNRIIAMPAYVGGEFNISGIKWIASFPDNIKKNLPRAHSVVILNDASTGVPVAIINSALLSIIRTASVSGLIIKYFSNVRPVNRFNIGIVGFGPIGQYHLKMCNEVLGNKVSNILLYDLKGIDKADIDLSDKSKVHITNGWQEVYDNSDIFITCTVSKERYIDKQPKEGSLHLNVSLRDYTENIYKYMKDSIIVDDWDEVCRENTDIELMHLNKGLRKEDTKSIIDVVCNECLKDYDEKTGIMFNPMGMATFDIAVAKYYFNKARRLNIGTNLD